VNTIFFCRKSDAASRVMSRVPQVSRTQHSKGFILVWFASTARRIPPTAHHWSADQRTPCRSAFGVGVIIWLNRGLPRLSRLSSSNGGRPPPSLRGVLTR